jgi:hypothetical protein
MKNKMNNKKLQLICKALNDVLLLIQLLTKMFEFFFNNIEDKNEE